MKTSATAALLAALALFAGLGNQAAAQDRRTYIVQLAGEPAAGYSGGVGGLAATRAPAGRRFDFRAAGVQSYVGLLQRRQQAVAAQVNARPIATYTTVLNGFAARLSDAEVQRLRTNPQVIDIQLDEARQPVTITTTDFLGLSAPGGVWSRTVGGGAPNKGDGVVIGVLDTGISPENPAFADKTAANGAPTHAAGNSVVYDPPPADWNGGCVAGPGFNPASHCNNKLIGANHFNAGFKAASLALHWSEFADSPRDALGGSTGPGGHGTHTASTAAGNEKNPVMQNGVSLGTASGMAPRARIAAYKICWAWDNPNAGDGSGGTTSCYTSDSVSAIEKAVQDGVDVINYSISGSLTSVNDPVEQAFLKAAAAGVFVAASAGNSGPSTAVAHISPWITTVAASTHDRFNQADLTLGSGAKFSGASLNVKALGAAPLILSTDARAAGASEGDADLCLLGSGGAPTLDPAKTAGKVVVCKRGTNARVEKGRTVANAGGVGMVLTDDGGGLVADVHVVPAVHVSASDGDAIRSLVAAGSATAAISAFYRGYVAAPMMAEFSSRGPNLGDINILKPDLTAPGVDVIAGVSANLSQADRDKLAAGLLAPAPAFASYSGTSMASPHVAGLAALLRQAHPGWSPAAIKSALMTTGRTTLDDGLTGAASGLLPWAQGAGHVVPNRATDPGLVFDSDLKDWTRYQCKVNRPAVANPADCTDPAIGTLAETFDLNLPSITVGSLIETATVTRRMTNVSGAPGTYTPSLGGLAGFSAVVSPASLTLLAGETKTFTVKLTASGSPENVWSYGALSWSDGSRHSVRIPLTVRAGKAISAPALVTGSGASGLRLVTVSTGYSGRMSATKGGLKDVTMVDGAGTLAPAKPSRSQLLAACVAGVDTAAVKVHTFNLPAGTIVARFALRQQDVSDAKDDFDLLLLRPDGGNVYSGVGGSNEAVFATSPAAGSHRVCVGAYRGIAAMTHRLSTWIVSAADSGGKFSVMVPSQVYSGGTATVSFSWSGLPAGGRFVGGAQFRSPSGTVQATTAMVVESSGAVQPSSSQPRGRAPTH